MKDSEIDTTDEPEVDEAPTTTPRQREMVVTIRPKTMLTALAALVVLAALVFAMLMWRSEADRADDLKARNNDRNAVTQVAFDFTQTLLTVNSANPAPGLDHLRSLATPNYQSRVDQARTSALSGAAGKAAVTSTATVDDVYVTDIHGDSASAIGVASVVVSAEGKSLPLTFYVKVDLRREGGDWKVDNVEPVAALNPQTATPTSTTAPTTAPPTSSPDTSSGG